MNLLICYMIHLQSRYESYPVWLSNSVLQTKEACFESKHPDTMSRDLGLLASLVLVVVVATVAHKEALAKDMTLAASWLVVAISMFGIGWSCGYDHNGKSSTCKVFVYKKLGKCYHALTCTYPRKPHQTDQVTIAQACERGFNPCKCAACRRVWRVLLLLIT